MTTKADISQPTHANLWMNNFNTAVFMLFEKVAAAAMTTNVSSGLSQLKNEQTIEGVISVALSVAEASTLAMQARLKESSEEAASAQSKPRIAIARDMPH